MAQPTPSAETQSGLSVPQALELAAGLSRQRRLVEAEQVYRGILQLRPDHPAALHGLGLLCRQTGRMEEAVSLLERAGAIDAGNAEAANDLGAVLAELARPAAALPHFERALAAKPDFVEARDNLGNALVALGRPDQAVAHFENALALRPQAARLHNNLGIALAAAKRHAAAIEHYRTALELAPGLAEAANNCGIALAALGRDGEALASFEQAAAVRPGYAAARANLARALGRLNRREEAVEHFQAALAANPGDADCESDFGNALARLDRHGEAVVRYRRALALRPDFGAALNNLANSLAALDRPDEALATYRQALAVAPDFAEAHNNLGNLLVARKQYDDAAGHFRAALAADPSMVGARVGLGRALEGLEQIEEALACYRQAIAADSENAAAYARLGQICLTLGRMAEGQSALDRAVELAPAQADYHRARAESRRIVADDPHLGALEDLVRNIETLPVDDRIALNFALAKTYGDLGQRERSFGHLLAGNALKRRTIDYDEAETVDKFERTARAFTPELLQRLRGFGDPSGVPVFIVGMPRSGTTLIEQILASHPEVHGAGELTDFSRAAAGICEPEGAAIPYPEMLASVPGEELGRLGAAYLARVAAKTPPAARVTDKMPLNFRFAGIIHLALPNAKIIHARRDPVDTCLSCFSKLFGGELSFTYDLAELGRYHRAYEALMAHWRAVLPAGAMLEVQYEELVADFEPQARRLVAYCGLDWDRRCLDFHETERPVRTASLTQVRQPLYQSAVGRWRPYEKWLGPLLEALGR